MLKERLVKYRFYLLAILLSALFTAYYVSVFTRNYLPGVTQVQNHFNKLEENLDNFLDKIVGELNNKSADDLWKKKIESNGFNLHIYQSDSLVYWNTNQLPINRFSDIHFPAEGVIHLQNGWYFAKIKKIGNYLVTGSFLIKRDFSYENKDLVNDFNKELNVPFEAGISLEQNDKTAIFSNDQEFLFSLLPDEVQQTNEQESQLLLFLLLGSIIALLIAINQSVKELRPSLKWTIFTLMILLRIASVLLDWFSFMSETHAFQPSLYGTNEWFPNFFEYLVNVVFILFIVNFFRIHLFPRVEKDVFKLNGIVLPVFNLAFWLMILFLSKGLIENSSIPLTIERLFTLNIYSVLAIVSIGVLCYAYFLLSLEMLRLLRRLQYSTISLYLIFALVSIVFLVYELKYGYQLFFAAIFPLIFISILIFITGKDLKRQHAGIGLLFLLLFSFVSAANLTEFNVRKEKGERELYANQLNNEQDIVTEVEYNLIQTKVQEDHLLQKLIETPMNMGISDFEDGLERRIFNGFWERYEMNFNLFDTTGRSLIQDAETQNNYSFLVEIIEHHGLKSEINPNLYFIGDFTNQYSYILKQPIETKDGKEAILFGTFKSKKIPEEIGFPRLLISSKAQVFESLENYSIAKYHKGKLIIKYGTFNFPTSSKAIQSWTKLEDNYRRNDGYDHYVLEKSDNNSIVLSSKNVTWVELITSFSYLFSFYGILLLPLFFRFQGAPLFKRTITLALKIQFVLIALVFVSLLAFGYGSGVFVRDQYDQYTNQLIREKLNSVDIELRNKLGKYKELTITKHGNTMEYYLQNFSKVFVTDINIYDRSGFLLASSRPKIFNIGLLSEQMNPEAFKALIVQNKSEYVHDENIGFLNYGSAYKPFYNHEGKILGFVNLQHFGQQKEFENQIQRFLVAIINVFMLLLAVSIVLAIFISNWVTTPLRLLHENFSTIKFGRHNQRISYDKEDEIGVLVRDYNQKLDELEYTANQLAQSERESAWREMAKQVAHEIKNPLTPMKLSIQQLLRVYDPNDPSSEQKLKRVANSIIEQIDALTNIANEFSNFAKMPRPDEIKLDLVTVLENVIEVFKEEGKANILLKSELDKAIILADKDQMVRIFNNLIKNAVQAIPDYREGNIEIRISYQDEKIHIEIEDNGVGIPKEKEANIFVPYFTTKTTGTGLGLAMVKQIIENHRGTIYFTTEENVGTIFYLDFPPN